MLGAARPYVAFLSLPCRVALLEIAGRTHRIYHLQILIDGLPIIRNGLFLICSRLLDSKGVRVRVEIIHSVVQIFEAVSWDLSRV